jgi:hypothetical protein
MQQPHLIPTVKEVYQQLSEADSAFYGVLHKLEQISSASFSSAGAQHTPYGNRSPAETLLQITQRAFNNAFENIRAICNAASIGDQGKLMEMLQRQDPAGTLTANPPNMHSVPRVLFPHPPPFEDGMTFALWRHEMENKMLFDNFPSDRPRGAYVFTRLTCDKHPRSMASPQQVAYEWIKQGNELYTHTDLLDFLETQYGENGTRLLSPSQASSQEDSGDVMS